MKLDDYRLLGRSGLRVSPLSLGTMTFGLQEGSWGANKQEAQAITDCYIDRGGNFIDTANFYGQMGQSEKWLGEFLKSKRDPVVISTKYTLTTQPGNPNASGNHRKNMVQSVEDSLRRLQTDYIDLLYLHMWDFRTPVDEILRSFDDLVRSGKVLYIGLSDVPAWQASRMQAIADLRGWTQFCALQISYSLIERTVERELIPMAKEMGMSVSPWSPLGMGILSGKYSHADLVASNSPESGQSRKAAVLANGRLNEKNLKIADVVIEIANEIGCTAAQVALAWTLINKTICSPVIGVRTVEQLEDNLGALAITLSADQIYRLDEASRVPPCFPMDLLDSAYAGSFFGNVSVEKRG